jgi:hypothetical protein
MWLCLLGISLTLGVLASAEGKRVVAKSFAEDSSYFVGDNCASTDIVQVELPRGAFGVRAVRPRVGDELRDGELGVVAEVTGFRAIDTGSQVEAEWTAKGAGTVCTNPAAFASGWSTPQHDFRAAYKTRERVYFSGALDSLRYKPKQVYFGNTAPITGLRWRRWGHSVARGRGVFHYNDCDPYCAAGSFTSYRVNLRLSRIRRCDGRLQYLTLVWRYVGSKPPGGSSSVRTTFGWKCD